MLKIVSYISFGIALIFAVLLGVLLLQNTKKKSLKVRKQLRNRRQFYGVAAAVFLVAGMVLQFVSVPVRGLREFMDEASPVDAYQKAVKSAGAEKALSSLPVELFAAGDDYYVRTGKNNIYGYLAFQETQTDEAGKESKTTVYKKGLSYKKSLMVTGSENVVSVVDTSGKLAVTGAFEYLTYEKASAAFQSKDFSDSCTFADGGSNTLFYVSDGDLYSVGYNSFGKLGDGTVRNRLNGTKILEDVASVSTSETHTLAVDIYGNLYGFGDNTYSEMGNRTTAASTTPIKLMSGVRQAEAGRYFSVILTKNGEVYTAGRNHLGQLGTGDTRDYATYKKILDGVCKISVGDHSCAALTANGILYVWGDNAAHQLGAGASSLTVPTQYAADVYDVAMGRSSMGMIKHNRDVMVTGKARAVQNDEFLQGVWQFSATVPETALYREQIVMPVRPQ